MSLSTLFAVLVVVGAYQLGVHTTRHPGDVFERMNRFCSWLIQRMR